MAWQEQLLCHERCPNPAGPARSCGTAWHTLRGGW